MITVREISTDCKKDVRRFILGAAELQKNDPNFVPPILMEQMDQFNPRKTPFFKHGKVHLLLAEEDGRFLGRLSVHTNEKHDAKYGPGTAFFGFCDFEDRPETVRALFEKGEALLRGHGATRVIGPFNFDINNECGILIEGFDTPPSVMMLHNPPYYAPRLEEIGYGKEKDLLAWTYSVSDVPEIARAAADSQRQTPGLVIREADPDRLEADIKIITDIYNDAWADNWGALPLDDEESKIIAEHIKPIFRKELVLIAELNGEPVAIAFGSLDVNETLRSLGRCNSIIDLLRFLWRLKFHPPKSARLLILGIKKACRGKGLKFLSVLLYTEMNDRAKKLGITKGECSWTLEDNDKINRGIELMGGKVYKKYRIYGKTL
jgi:hypothetical protein